MNTSSHHTNSYSTARTTYHQSNNVGYPYNQPPVPPTTQPYRPLQSCCRLVFSGVLILLLSYCILAVLVYLFIGGGVQPEIQVVSASATSISELTAWDVTFFVRNPSNNMRLRYTDFLCKMFLGNTLFAASTTKPFVQNEMNKTTIQLRFATDPKDALIAAEQGHGIVSLDFVLDARMQTRSTSERLQMFRRLLFLPNLPAPFRVRCNEVKFEFPSVPGNATLLGEPLSCKVIYF